MTSNTVTSFKDACEARIHEVFTNALTEDNHNYISLSNAASDFLRTILNRTADERAAVEEILLWHAHQESYVIPCVFDQLPNTSVNRELVNAIHHYYRMLESKEPDWMIVDGQFKMLPSGDPIAEFMRAFYLFKVAEKSGLSMHEQEELLGKAHSRLAFDDWRRDLQVALVHFHYADLLLPIDSVKSYYTFNAALLAAKKVLYDCPFPADDVRKQGLVFTFWSTLNAIDMIYPKSIRGSVGVAFEERDMSHLRECYPLVCAMK
jgi:hypothetical protein